jgi:hypothetical protein
MRGKRASCPGQIELSINIVAGAKPADIPVEQSNE